MEPCQQTPRMDALERQQDSLTELFRTMEKKFDAKLDLILTQLNKIAILEASHNNHVVEIERMQSKIDLLTQTINGLEAYKNKMEGMVKMAWVMWSALGISIVGIINKISQ